MGSGSKGASLVGLTVALWSLPAAADAQLHATGQVGIGYNDNVLLAPSNTNDPNAAAPVARAFVDLRPGLLGIWQTERATHSLSLVHSTNLFLGSPDANSYSNTLGLASNFLLSPRWVLGLGASVTQSRINTANLLNGAGNANLQVQQAGGAQFLAFQVMQSLRYQPAPRWTITQQTQLGHQRPFEITDSDAGAALQPSTFTVGEAFTITKRFDNDSLGLLPAFTYFYTPAITVDGAETPAQDQLAATLQLQWRHDLSLAWSTTLSAGATRTSLLTTSVDGAEALYTPAVGAGINFRQQGYSAGLTLSRGVQPNLLVGSFFISDSALLQGQLPLWRQENINLSASVGAQHNKQVDNAQGLTGTTYVFLADMGVNWTLRSGFSFGARVSHMQQHAGSGAEAVGRFDLKNNVAQLTFGGTWPRLNRQRPVPTIGPSVRVDGSDQDIFQQSPENADQPGGAERDGGAGTGDDDEFEEFDD